MANKSRVYTLARTTPPSPFAVVFGAADVGPNPGLFFLPPGFAAQVSATPVRIMPSFACLLSYVNIYVGNWNIVPTQELMCEVLVNGTAIGGGPIFSAFEKQALGSIQYPIQPNDDIAITLANFGLEAPTWNLTATMTLTPLL